MPILTEKKNSTTHSFVVKYSGNGKNNCENSKRWVFFCCFIRFMLVCISRRHLHIKMGRGKHCSAEKRELIRKLISARKSYREVGRLVECSNKMIRNAIEI